MEMKVKQFLDSAEQRGGESSIISWKDKGKLIFFLHPKSEIEERWVHRFPALISREVETDDGGKKIKKIVISERIICPGADSCFIHKLIKKLNKFEDLEDDEIIIELGKKANRTEICKGELLGKKTYDWRYNLTARREFVFIAVTVKNPIIGKLVTTTTLGEKIAAVIKDQMEEEGDDAGNPFKNPYAIKTTYDPDKAGSEMYNAHFNSKKPTEDIEELFESEIPDISGLVNPTSFEKTLSLMKEAIEHPRFEKFLIKLEEKVEGLDEEEEKSKKKKKRKKEKEDEEEEDTEDSDEDEDDDEVKDKKKKKKKEKQQEDDDEDENEDDDEDEEDNKKKKKKKKSKSEKVVCPDCDTEVDEKETTCPECGNDLEIPF